MRIAGRSGPCRWRTGCSSARRIHLGEALEKAQDGFSIEAARSHPPCTTPAYPLMTISVDRARQSCHGIRRGQPAKFDEHLADFGVVTAHLRNSRAPTLVLRRSRHRRQEPGRQQGDQGTLDGPMAAGELHATECSDASALVEQTPDGSRRSHFTMQWLTGRCQVPGEVGLQGVPVEYETVIGRQHARVLPGRHSGDIANEAGYPSAIN